MPPASKRNPVHHTPTTSSPHQIVDPRWIVKAFGITTLVAAICGYVVLCGLFYYGQWQLVLTPSRAVAHTPAELGLPFNEVRFGPDASGQPQLDGWWFPSDSSTDPTVLMLHAGTGSIGDALSQARMFHETHLSVLLFDYRGFGHSGGQHPTQALMQQDANSAFNYLVSQKQIAPQHIIVYGEGVAASLAVRLCADHHEIAALILNNATGDMLQHARDDSRARMVPVGLLFHEAFPLAETLRTLTTPKLLISHTDSSTPPAKLQQAADPKMTVELPPGGDETALRKSLHRFIDTYIPHPPPQIIPTS